MILTARDRRLRFLSLSVLSLSRLNRLILPCSPRTRPFPITLSRSRARVRLYVHTSTSLARSAKGLVHKFAIRENISADGQLRYPEREKEERERRMDNAKKRGGEGEKLEEENEE